MATSSKNLSTATQRVVDVLLAKCDGLENLLPTRSGALPTLSLDVVWPLTRHCAFSVQGSKRASFFGVPSFKAGLSASNLRTGFGLKFEGVGFRPLEF